MNFGAVGFEKSGLGFEERVARVERSTGPNAFFDPRAGAKAVGEILWPARIGHFTKSFLTFHAVSARFGSVSGSVRARCGSIRFVLASIRFGFVSVLVRFKFGAVRFGFGLVWVWLGLTAFRVRFGSLRFGFGSIWARFSFASFRVRFGSGSVSVRFQKRRWKLEVRLANHARDAMGHHSVHFITHQSFAFY